jgi:hypothetical protein
LYGELHRGVIELLLQIGRTPLDNHLDDRELALEGFGLGAFCAALFFLPDLRELMSRKPSYRRASSRVSLSLSSVAIRAGSETPHIGAVWRCGSESWHAIC